MSPIQQILLGSGVTAKKTYVDDVFSTYVYEGDGTTSHQIINGIDLASNGGMIWGKERGNTGSHYQFDTVRGLNKRLKSNSTSAEETDTFYSSVNSNGYTINKTTSVNIDGNNYASWSFRKAPGFFDVVTYTGNGVDGRSISHSLGCIPGMWMVKRTDGTGSWIVGHSRMLGGTGDDYKYHMYLNTTDDKDVNGEFTYNSPPTTTTLSLGSSSAVNGDGNSYVCYLFAGGESTATTARSVDFGGSPGDELSIASTSDFAFGTGDFTIEFWLKWETGGSNYPHILDMRDDGNDFGTTNRVVLLIRNPSKDFKFMLNGSFVLASTDPIPRDTWNHFAVVRNSGTTSLYVNGVSNGSFSDSTNYGNAPAVIGQKPSDDNPFSGKISNLRIVKGTAVYTSTFRPTYEPLTNITNTKLLCCNNSSVTGSTVTPSTISSGGTVTASSDSPFDDTNGFVFGENEDQNVIKCGSYMGNGSDTGPVINLGWEPQWLMVKRTDSADKWPIYDSMRGIVTGGNDARLYANLNNSEYTSNDYFELTPTGFKITKSSGEVNGNGGTYIYTAIRRPDGYVGKPPELGTDVFAMDTGNSSSTIPAFDSTFPVDFALSKLTGDNGSWDAVARLMQHWYLYANKNDEALQDTSNYNFDSNAGWSVSYPSTYQSWMWKRHKGMDVVTYLSNGVRGREIPHNLSKTPEMMWIKSRSVGYDWVVYHKGLNGGTNPEQKYLQLNSNNGEATATVTRFNNTAPTSTHFTVGEDGEVNGQDSDGTKWDYIAMLFASVDGISKVGSYTGDDSTDGSHEINVGFTPRLLIIKRADGSADWRVFDTTNGFPTSGAANFLEINTIDGKYTGSSTTATQSTNGFKLWSAGSPYNANNAEYIYYAHA